MIFSAVVPMMIGFGDDDCPLDETVDLVEVCASVVHCFVSSIDGYIR